MSSIRMDDENLVLGFIGTGAIAEAMCTGLKERAKFAGSIVLSNRSATRSASLSQRYAKVVVSSDIQELVDQSQVVILSTLPTQLPEAIKGITFRPDQVVISLVAATFLADLRTLLSPVSRIYRLIPMPPIELGVGPIALCPSDEKIKSFLSPLGEVLDVNDEKEFDTMSAASSVMASFFAWSATVSKWMTEKGFEEEASANYVSSLFEALAAMLKKEDYKGVQQLSEECVTKGGLNEQLLKFNSDAGFFDQLPEGLDQILERIEKY